MSDEAMTLAQLARAISPPVQGQTAVQIRTGVVQSVSGGQATVDLSGEEIPADVVGIASAGQTVIVLTTPDRAIILGSIGNTVEYDDTWVPTRTNITNVDSESAYWQFQGGPNPGNHGFLMAKGAMTFNNAAGSGFQLGGASISFPPGFEQTFPQSTAYRFGKWIVTGSGYTQVWHGAFATVTTPVPTPTFQGARTGDAAGTFGSYNAANNVNPEAKAAGSGALRWSFEMPVVRT